MRRRPAIFLRVGRMYCPRKRSGSMPAEQARPRRTRGVLISIRAMRIITAILDKLLMWGSTVPTPGAFLICMAMCGSGRRTGMQHTVLEHRLILRVQLRAPTVSSGRLLDNTGAYLRSAYRARYTPATATTASASVSVSNSSELGTEG